MLTDRLSTFGLSLALTGSGAGSFMIGTALDINTARDIGAGRPVYLVITAQTDLAGTGTIEFALSTAASAAVGTSDPEVVVTPKFVGNNVSAGDVLWAGSLPVEGTVYNQFLKIKETATTTAITGSINAMLTFDVQAYKNLPDANN